jgi:hypothetical protein
MSFHPFKEFETIIPHWDFGAGWNRAHFLGLAVGLCTDHELRFLTVKRVDALLLLTCTEGVVVGSEDFILLGQSMVDDIATEGA